MTSFTPGPLVAHKECVFFANKAGGFSLSDCPNAEANAHRIAHCWNSHAELLEALKLCAAVCAGETMHKRGLIDALEKARAAISKATE
jgi:hypothetical protein